MKKQIITGLMILSAIPALAQLSVGTPTPDTSAQLDLYAESLGFLPPRLSTIQRDQISQPATGLLIFNYDANCPEIYDGAEWKTQVVETSTLSLSFIGVVQEFTGIVTVGEELDMTDDVHVIVVVGVAPPGTILNSYSFPSEGVLGLTAVLPVSQVPDNSQLKLYIIGKAQSTGTATFNIGLGSTSLSFDITVTN